MAGQGPDLDQRDPNGLNSHIQVWIFLLLYFMIKKLKVIDKF